MGIKKTNARLTWSVLFHRKKTLSSPKTHTSHALIVSASPSFLQSHWNPTPITFPPTECRPTRTRFRRFSVNSAPEMGAETTSIGGALVPTVKSEAADSTAGAPSPSNSEIELESDKDILCPICMQIIKDAFLTSCGHSFCYMCIVTHLQNKSDCPCCSHFLTANHLYPNFLLNKVYFNVFILFYDYHFCVISHHPFVSSWLLLVIWRIGRLHPFNSILNFDMCFASSLSYPFPSYWDFLVYCSGQVLFIIGMTLSWVVSV